MSKNIEYQGETYRDDRIFVMNLSYGKLEVKSKTIQKFILVTYRNNIQLVARRADHFDTKEEAKNYIKKVEHETPLISLNGQPLGVSEKDNRWDIWLSWLKEQNLHSAISGYQNVPYRYNSDGGDFKRDNYITLHINDEGKTLINEDMTDQKLKL